MGKALSGELSCTWTGLVDFRALWVDLFVCFFFSKDVFPEIMRLFSNVNVEVIPDAGHWVHFEQPSLFMDCVNRYFSQTEL